MNATLTASAAAARCCCPQPGFDPANPSNASTRMQGGLAVFENDNYRITAGDNNEVIIHNKATGETYRAWGDPHFEVDGKHAFDFWGTTTFALDDGTKVTIQTTPWGNNPNATLSSKVTITNGDYGVQITGVDTNTHGDLAIDEGKGWGLLVDAAVADGNTLYENTFGKGFVAFDSCGRLQQVDQSFINKTDLLKGGQLQARYADAFRLLGGLMSISFVGAFLGTLAAIGMAAERPRAQPQPAPWRPLDTAGVAATALAAAALLPPATLALTLMRWNAQG
jgi:Domain of Unknown Function (DUF1521)